MKCNKTIIFNKDEWLLINNLIELAEKLSDKKYLNCDTFEAIHRLMEFIAEYHFCDKNLNICELGTYSVRVDTDEQEAEIKKYKDALEMHREEIENDR